MKIKTFCAILLPAIAVGGLSFWPAKSGLSLPSPSLKQAAVVALAVVAATSSHHEPTAPLAAVPVPPQEVDLGTGLRQRVLRAEFKGNGRETLRAALFNNSPAPLTVRVAAGAVFENPRNSVVVTRPGLLTLAPGKAGELSLQTAALRSGNKIAEATFRPTFGSLPQLEALLGYIRDHADFTPGAIQTAVLAATENLPLSAVARFSSAGGQLRSRFDTSAFRVETADIVAALLALRETGRRDDEVAMSIDPQLKIEAMIDPQARPAAMRYYGLTPENDWEFWKNELATGDTATRHYALYGIARFYPDVALDMLPKWARETRTGAVFRLAAVQALADTDRPEALPILRQLADELGRYTDLGRAAASTAEYLDAHLSKVAANQPTVAFRGGPTAGSF